MSGGQPSLKHPPKEADEQLIQVVNHTPFPVKIDFWSKIYVSAEKQTYRNLFSSSQNVQYLRIHGYGTNGYLTLSAGRDALLRAPPTHMEYTTHDQNKLSSQTMMFVALMNSNDPKCLGACTLWKLSLTNKSNNIFIVYDNDVVVKPGAVVMNRTVMNPKYFD